MFKATPADYKKLVHEYPKLLAGYHRMITVGIIELKRLHSETCLLIAASWGQRDYVDEQQKIHDLELKLLNSKINHLIHEINGAIVVLKNSYEAQND